jgi:steroid Delta-isomerase
MPQSTTAISPALAASQAEWKTAQSNDREGWLALMADDVVIEDPIGVSVANPDGNGLRGKEGAGTFYDTFIGTNKLTFTCEETLIALIEVPQVCSMKFLTCEHRSV